MSDEKNPEGEYVEEEPEEVEATGIRARYKREENDIKVDNMRWRNRRRMAWLSLISILIVTGIMIFYVPEARLTKLEVVITWFYMVMASIVGAYMGFATLSMIKGK